MANIPTTSWSELTPAGGDSINAGDNRIREMKTQVREIVGVDHDFPSSGQDGGVGQHYRITLQEQADLGTGIPGDENTQSTEDNNNDVGICFLGAQTVDDGDGGTKPELVFTDEDDNDVQITANGKIKLANGRLENEAYLIARNADDDGNVNLIRARTLTDAEESYTTDDDVMEVATSVVIKGDLTVEGNTVGDDAINGIQADSIIAREALVLRESSGITTDYNECILYAANDGVATELYFKGENNGSAALYDNATVKLTKDGRVNLPFGAWATKAAGTTYQAATDGFVVGYFTGTSGDSKLLGYTDANSTPVTLVAYDWPEPDDRPCSFMFPVRKGDYWVVSVSSGSAVVRWLPLGG